MNAPELLGALALLMAVPGTAYLTALSLAAWAGRGERYIVPSGPDAVLRVVIVVPAHNESMHLLRTLHSLKADMSGDRYSRIVVIADNCTDDTAVVATAAGVDVLERQDPDRRGKGHALRYAFELIDDADWFVVVDADTDVGPGFLRALRAAMAQGADALQCRYRVREALSCVRSALADVALGGWNVLRPRGRDALGLSAGILGNGFALSRKTLQRVPYAAASIVEDVEYHLMLVRAGLRVRWVDDAEVRGEMPVDRSDSVQQRARWEGGRLQLLRSRLPGLLLETLRGRWRLVDPALDLLLWPLSWLVCLLLLALALGIDTVQVAAVTGLAAIGMHLVLTLRLMGAGRAHLLALLAGGPAHLVWKLSLLPAIWQSANQRAPWVRSARKPG